MRPPSSAHSPTVGRPPLVVEQQDSEGERDAMNRLCRSLVLSALALTVDALLVPSIALAAPKALSKATECTPLRADPNAATDPVATVYYVTVWPGVNLRHGPGRGSCVVTTQGYTVNVVAVPGMPEMWNGGSWWREVAYYRGGGPTAAAYSWANVGWIAAPFLHQATVGATCVAASCQGFQTNGVGWSVLGPFPNTWDGRGCQYACWFGPIWLAWACAQYDPAHRSVDRCWGGDPYGNGFGQSGTLGAATANPNWFVVGYRPETLYTLIWQYAWWLS
jgi:hypothetical protein